MSFSSLYGIKKDYTGEELFVYGNSWLFSPMVWDILSDKYIPRRYGMIQSIIGLDGLNIHTSINDIMNNSNNTPDRICWEISNQLVFFTKDKKCVVNNICKFIEQNKAYGKSRDDNIAILEREHIVERFNDIASDILSLDENEYPYFVFKNTSADDNIERWFYEYDKSDERVDKSLKDCNEYVTEFVVIKNGKIEKFISNLDFEYK